MTIFLKVFLHSNQIYALGNKPRLAYLNLEFYGLFLLPSVSNRFKPENETISPNDGSHMSFSWTMKYKFFIKVFPSSSIITYQNLESVL